MDPKGESKKRKPDSLSQPSQKRRNSEPFMPSDNPPVEAKNQPLSQSQSQSGPAKYRKPGWLLNWGKVDSDPPQQTGKLVVYHKKLDPRDYHKPEDGTLVFKTVPLLGLLHDFVTGLGNWAYDEVWNVKLTFYNDDKHKKEREQEIKRVETMKSISACYKKWVSPWVAAEIKDVLLFVETHSRNTLDFNMILKNDDWLSVAFRQALITAMKENQPVKYVYGHTKESDRRNTSKRKVALAKLRILCEQHAAAVGSR